MKNKCQSPQKLQEFLDHSLAADAQDAVAKHISSCSSCKIELEALKQVYSAAEKHGTRQLNQQISNDQLNSLMSRIAAKTTADKADSQTVSNFGGLLKQLSKWLLAPALAIILIFAVVKNSEPESSKLKSDLPGFSLEQNRAEVIFDPGTPLLLDNKAVNSSELTSIPVGIAVKLPDDMLIQVKINQSSLTCSDGAIFSLTNQSLKLASGKAEFNLSGPHKGFQIKTPFATITPLGTKFNLDIRSYFAKIELSEGEIEIQSKSGIKRQLSQPGHLFVNESGHFSADFPQAATVSENDRPGLPATMPRPAPLDNSPTRILDSF